MAVYEVGVVGLGAKAIRNGADIWLRGFLELLDFGQYFLLPVLVIGILLGWHYTTRQAWRVPRGVLSGMCVECAALAVCLWVVSQAEAWILQAAVGTVMSIGRAAAVASSGQASLAGFIGFFGAGVYEELLFRLMLLPAMAWGIRRLGAPDRSATVLAVVALQRRLCRGPLRGALRRADPVGRLRLLVRPDLPLPGRRVLQHPLRRPRFRHRRGHARRI